ncbi:23S rRNA (uracil(1939)-C(5))-methyltransferase RlmD [Wukongibacter baidiensis]|uniref:23S rRNA (uracil(1939)-C(5))-methyltransferase RlmD n=1 Tax=Wukongibacter baidiensis TaxID=1723361 RepID=UPI003D7FECD8
MELVKKNDVIEVEIIDMGDSGEGIGRYEGLTIFAEGAILGDIVKVQINKVKKRFALGETVETIEPSKNRIESDCKYSKDCGGCQLREMNYETTLKLKEKQVKDALERIGGLTDVNVKNIIGMDDPNRYRNKVLYPIAKDGITDNPMMPSIGFYKKKTHNIVNVNTCLLQNEVNDVIIQTIREFIKENEIRMYNTQTKKGVIRKVMIRNSSANGDVMVIIVTNGKHFDWEEALVTALTSKVDKIKSIVINVNKSPINTGLAKGSYFIYGSETITDKIGDFEFAISPRSFFQVNPVQTEKLYKKAIEYAGLTGNETVFDVYCGAGTISLFLAQSAKTVYGIESVEPAVMDADKNATTNGITNIEFCLGEAEVVMPKLNEERITADVVVIDPPRKGCEQIVLDTIIKMAPKTVVYVSCKPSTLARDLKILTDGGYSLEEVQPVDMFPWTTHVECCSLLVRKDK